MDTPNFSPDGLAGGAASLRAGSSSYQEHTSQVAQLIESKKGTWDGINAESVARMRLQNRFRTGLDIARAIALGADAGGMALPLFRAQQEGGFKGAEAALEIVVAGLKQALLLTGSRTVDALKRSPRVIVGELKDWLAALEEKSWRR